MSRMDKPDGSDGSLPLGNTKTKGRCNAAKNWCWTWNNFPLNFMDQLAPVFSKEKISYYTGEEKGDSGTPHLQGFLISPKKIRPMETFKIKEIHWEKMKGSIQDNFNYCSKQNGKKYTNMDLSDFTTVDPMAGLEWYSWQIKVRDTISSTPDPRKIYWIWSKQGCKGKTTLAKHICLNYKNAIYVNGKANDIKYAICEMWKKTGKKTNIVLFGFPRDWNPEAVSYIALEEIKDGIFFSSKFESGMYIGNPPHVFIFSNFAPDVKKLSEDRWEIINIDE